MTWALIGSRQKSATEVTRLVTDVIQAPDFIPEELAGFEKLSLELCCGQTQCNWHSSAMHLHGRSIYFLGIYSNMCVTQLTHKLVIPLHSFCQ